ncbi:hypothetical protein [hymenopteran rhabdo-related virus 109]|uniref:Uncharacterized protein n=1 Tax=hymenopteran rhabdo-related virus 109 TaxID=2847803 RepID=A0A7D7F1A0_9RHAB|nr:hypothetical protein QKO60_gp3 [hymenopteran rhabdo-related virus 109]QMP82142.1 hypothetical protein [hymenopteran rhabdo-related virus 109]
MMRVRRFLKGRDSIPIAPPLTLLPGNFIIGVSGYISLDFEGPIPHESIVTILKRISALISITLFPSELESSHAIAFLMQYFYHLCKEVFPGSMCRTRSLVPRAAFVLPIKGYTSSSCIHQCIEDKNIPLDLVWEFPGITSYPIIISVSGSLHLEVETIGSRDRFRNAGFEAIPYPHAKWEKRAKSIHTVRVKGHSDLQSVLLSWPTSRRHRLRPYEKY